MQHDYNHGIPFAAVQEKAQLKTARIAQRYLDPSRHVARLIKQRGLSTIKSS
jgi:hypothetical protein